MPLSSPKIFLLLSAFFVCGTLHSAPILRAGIMTDTHVTREKSSCRKLKYALEFFKKNKVDLVINAGDIADIFDPDSYKNYRQTVQQVFCNTPMPEEIFAYANHERINRPKDDIDQVFQEVKQLLKIPHEPYAVRKIKGCTFIVVPQFVDIRRYKSMLDKAAEENQGRPFFVIDHAPPANTVFASEGLDIPRRKLLDNYPDAVVICGHKHNTLKSELAVWQGNFTVVSAGGMYRWRPFLTGTPWFTLSSDMFLLLEVYPDKLLFRRISPQTGKEYKPENVWSIPLPFDRKTAPYDPQKRKKETLAPAFAADAKIKAKITPQGIECLFPHAQSRYGVYQYKFELFRKEKGILKRFALFHRMGNFVSQKANGRELLNIGLFTPEEEALIKITPLDFWFNEGKSISKSITIPARTFTKSEIQFESKNILRDCKIFTGTGKETPVIDKENFIHIPEGKALRVIFPGNIWRGKAGTPYRFTVEMELKDSAAHNRFMVLQNPDPKDAATGRILLPRGNAGKLRYVFDHSKREDDYNFFLALTSAGAGKVRIHRIKSELLEQ